MSASLVPLSHFTRLYVDSLDTVFRFWTPHMQEQLARHCRPWAPQRYDFRQYLELSALRCYRAYQVVHAAGPRASVCDVGGFWGVFCITLSKLGHPTTMTEALRYYGNAFDELFGSIRDHGVTIIDMDPFESGTQTIGPFDVVTLMAVLEHYPHSPRVLLDNVVRMTRRGGRVYLEAPNIAYWPKRVSLLMGRSPLPPIRDVHASAVPYVGHHHEYTLDELLDLATLHHLEVVETHCFNYSQQVSLLHELCAGPVQSLAFRFFPCCREVLAIHCRRN